ncbi:GPI inositol-deacylase [Eupeodes corollae]|uniref:GPI inositol-deacylase n=1 Tax=Eupeodes corollae TaxID=290404 RepID=UPI00248FA64E|nr:GPI inositol-deacylase [Eupeodes corollae]
MYKHLIVVIALSSLCCFLYGIANILLNVETNECQMTYMYQLPTFIKIHVDEGKQFPKYNLYSYAEGSLIENARSLKFNGAPVIFIPGNSGSHKQGRSLGSTALRKGIDNDLNHHLDYFLVDYDEEFSALFGGYLNNQKEFLKKCITSILKLYKHLPNAPKQVVLIGHSMGGKVAQALLTDESVAGLINTIIFIATPIDRPVVNFDVHMEAAYRETNDYLQLARKTLLIKNDTNYCTTPYSKSSEEPKSLDDKLLISIGGGNRDLLVHAGLTYSKFSDINVMTSTIPNVWLSTDHVASVWCLQLVLVINRFLFSIISSSRANAKLGLTFVEDKSTRLAKAEYYFVRPKSNTKNRNFSLTLNEDSDEWFEDTRRVFSKDFSNGIDHFYIQMIPLNEKRQYKRLYADVINLESEDWVFGCDAKEFKPNMKYCSTGQSISHHVEKLPNSKQKRMFVSVDLHKIKKTYPNWTHIVLRIPPTRSNVKLNIDIHDPEERTLRIKAPKWFSYTKNQLTTDSTLGASHYKILISDLDESHQSIKFNIKPHVCSKPTHKAITKTCVPWAKGFERYQHISDSENNPLLVSVPISKPSSYNTTLNPVTINLHLDPNCRYQITYQNSFEGTMSRIVQQYAHWLPAHLTAVLLLSFKYQLSLTPHRAPFKCGKVHSAIVHSGTFFIITVTKIISKILQSVKFLPDPDNFHHSMLISFIIHGSASALMLLSAAGVWAIITFYGNIIHRIFLRLTRLSTPVFSIALPIIERFPIIAGVALVAIGFASCGGIALILGCLVYLMLIAKQYEDYLETFVFETVVTIAKKLFGKTLPTTEVHETRANTEQEFPDDTRQHDVDDDQQSLLVSNKEDSQAVVKATNEETESSEIEDINESSDQDKELEQLLNEAIQKQKEILKEKQDKRQQERIEYDAVHEGLVSVNFHMTLFLLMCILTIVFIPTTISWARDFRYSKRLSPDPSLFPATIVLVCVFGLWQISAPKNLYAYNFVASILYACAAICVIYCQDSIYRLSAVIPAVFVMVFLHQIFSTTKSVESDFDPDVQEVQNRIDKMKAVLDDANLKKTD